MMSPFAAVFATLILLSGPGAESQPGKDPQDRPDLLTIARIKYQGGGDWYNGPTEIPNLLAYIRNNTPVKTAANEVRVEILDEAFFSYPISYLTGHGNIRFSENEVRRLRLYLENGGFLIANDDYGLDLAFRREMGRVFPDKALVELPPTFELYHRPYRFDTLPKIHEHDGGRPQALGLFEKDRLILLYTFESDLGDGWEDPHVHGDPDEKRRAALEMGTNIVVWALVQ